MLDKFVENKGYSLIACLIFDKLDTKSLASCREVSKSMAAFIGEQKFWNLRKLWRFLMEDHTSYSESEQCVQLKKIAVVKHHPEWKIVYDYLKEQKGQEVLLHFLEVLDHHEKLMKSLKKAGDFTQFSYMFGTYSPLHYAVFHGDIQFVDFLLNTNLGEGFNPFSVECKLSLTGRAIFQEVDSLNKLVFRDDGENYVKIHYYPKGEPRIRRHILIPEWDWELGICYEPGCNVFHIACFRGHTEIVKLLLKHSKEKAIDINKRSGFLHYPPLRIAKENPELIELLFDNCTDYDEDDYEHFNKETVRAILINKFKKENEGKLEDHQYRKRKYLKACEDYFSQLTPEQQLNAAYDAEQKLAQK